MSGSPILPTSKFYAVVKKGEEGYFVLGKTLKEMGDGWRAENKGWDFVKVTHGTT